MSSYLQLLLGYLSAGEQQPAQRNSSAGSAPAADRCSALEAANGSLEAANASRAELAECAGQLRLLDYYAGYDISVGLRIATTLTILFVVFILFVMYKTGCREGGRASRSQLQLTSAGRAPQPGRLVAA